MGYPQKKRRNWQKRNNIVFLGIKRGVVVEDKAAPLRAGNR